jgi:hypothetical protein
MAPEMEGELEEVVRMLAQNRWPWRLHATYDETISRALDVFEKVNQDIPLAGLNWFFDHCETISEKLDRPHRGAGRRHRRAAPHGLPGRILRRALRPGAAEATPPVRKHAGKGREGLAGTDATRVASYNPWVSLSWLVTGKTVGGMQLYPQRNCLDREPRCACGPRTSPGSPTRSARRAASRPASSPTWWCPTGLLRLRRIGDRRHHRAAHHGRRQGGLWRRRFRALDEGTPPPAMPDWSPVRTFGGYAGWGDTRKGAPLQKRVAQRGRRLRLRQRLQRARPPARHGLEQQAAVADLKGFWGALGCACWAV